ncbi:MAG: carbamate kinase, partial [Candidatus Eisenbacteria bacterium]|nr:carbamate kinase [Candidatus Eisenbacteria bacterium]
MTRTVLLSLGGNAILPGRGAGTIEEQRRVTHTSMVHVADLLEAGARVILTHGNGPIVGNILIRNDLAKDRIPPMPLDVCGADSEGGIGYMIQQSLQNILRERRIPRVVVTAITQVVVSPDDPAFTHPTKPIGPFYSPEEARRLQADKGWTLAEDAGRGIRRVVPSPVPLRIVEVSAIRTLFEAGHIVIAAGGGGIPVVEEHGRLRGVEAVIDKDLASIILALAVRVDTVVNVTAIDQVALDFGKPTQRNLSTLTLEEAKRHLRDGQFPDGSMGPKIRAAVQFLEGGGREVIITSPSRVREALDGLAAVSYTHLR